MMLPAPMPKPPPASGSGSQYSTEPWTSRLTVVGPSTTL